MTTLYKPCYNHIFIYLSTFHIPRKMVYKESHIFISTFIILLVSFFSATDATYIKLSSDLPASASSEKPTELQQALQGKSNEEIISYLQDRYGEENVVVNADLASLTPLTGQVVQDPGEIMSLIKDIYDKLPQANQREIDNWIRKILKNREAGCKDIILLRPIFGKLGKRMPLIGKVHRPQTPISASDAGRIYDIIQIILQSVFCRGPPPAPPTGVRFRVPVPADYTKTDWYKNQQKWTVNDRTLPPIPVSTPETVLGPGSSLIPILVYTGAAILFIIILTICGPVIISIAAASLSAFTGLMTAEAATVGGTAILLGMLTVQGGAQNNPLTLADIQTVQAQIDLNRNNPTYFNQFNPQNCPIPPQIDTFIITPPLTLTPTPITPQTLDCSTNPDLLQQLAFTGLLPQSTPSFLISFFIGLPGAGSTFNNLELLSATPGIVIGRDIGQYHSTNTPLQLDLTQFCYRKQGMQSFELTFKYNPFDPLNTCNPFTISGAVDCGNPTNSFMNPYHLFTYTSGGGTTTPGGGGPLPKTPVACAAAAGGTAYNPDTQYCQDNCPRTQVCSTGNNNCQCIAKEKLCSNHAPLQPGQQCKNDCPKNTRCNASCTGCEPITGSGDATGSNSPQRNSVRSSRLGGAQ